MPRTPKPLLDRLMAKVAKSDGCWEWTGAKTGGGYGYINLGRRGIGVGRAHRLVYEALIGPIPEGLVLDHLCRNPGCVRPDHLEPVTQAENLRRSKTNTATTCINGHPWSENAVMWGGHRKCRQCNRASSSAAHARRVALKN